MGLSLTFSPVIIAGKRVSVTPKQKDAQRTAERQNSGKVLGYRNITAYTASRDETDATPCLTATGYNICENPKGLNIVASNELEFGTKVKIGQEVYTVLDRMHKRFDYRMDILMDSKKEAFRWGKRKKKVIVLDS